MPPAILSFFSLIHSFFFNLFISTQYPVCTRLYGTRKVTGNFHLIIFFWLHLSNTFSIGKEESSPFLSF